MTYQQNRNMQQGRESGRPRFGGQSPAGNGLGPENAVITGLTSLQHLQPEDLVAIAEKAGKFFSENRIKTTQIRRIHEHVIRQVTRARTNKGESAKEIRLLKYHLAYAAGRERNMRPFSDFFSPVLDKVTGMEDLERFRQLFDAVLAYHKFYGSN
ncbi:MAG: type III-A CRISPR-associated protein Csm2 [Synergistaceae bacterium]|nr:type III-A CRISPR-associated protein Csm2 [Synergistaceae bacterium]